MKRTLMTASLLALGTVQAQAPDPYLWLEEVEGERAMAWVKERNAETEGLLKSRPEYKGLRTELLEALNARDRIPGFRRMGDYVYNLWQDEKNKRGLWRRTTLAEYAKPEPAWETVLDMDALGKLEGKSWVFSGASCLAPAYQRCLAPWPSTVMPTQVSLVSPSNTVLALVNGVPRAQSLLMRG